MATAKKRGDSWRTIVYVGTENGKRKYKSFTASTKKEAERLAAIYLSEHKEENQSDITLQQAIDKYIESKKNILSPRSITSYQSIRRNYLQSLMHMHLSDIKKEFLQNAFNLEAAKVSPKTLRSVHGLISAVYKMQDAYLPKILLPQKQKSEMSIPTAKDISLLLEAFSNDEDMRLAVMLAAYLGLRRSELCALQMKDYKNGVLAINKAIVKNEEKEWVVKQPKSTAGYRKIPVPDILATELDNIKRKQDENIVRLSPDLVTHRFVDKREILPELTMFRFHDLRHYYASVMLALGVPDKYAMERMGHATNNMLKTVYQHTMKDKQNEISETLNAYFEKNATKNATTKNEKPRK